MPTEHFQDVLKPAGDVPIRVRAKLFVISTADGGRQTPFRHPYRPNHNFGGPENRLFYIGQIEVPEGVEVFPGDVRELEITFLNVEGLADVLIPGRHWRIQEGSKLVANAELLSFVHET